MKRILVALISLFAVSILHLSCSSNTQDDLIYKKVQPLLAEFHYQRQETLDIYNEFTKLDDKIINMPALIVFENVGKMLLTYDIEIIFLKAYIDVKEDKKKAYRKANIQGLKRCKSDMEIYNAEISESYPLIENTHIREMTRELRDILTSTLELFDRSIVTLESINKAK